MGSPQKILITTFTVKAAKEIRIRLLDWGEPLIDELRGPRRSSLAPDFAVFLDTVDVNRCVTGTLDGFCQDSLSQHREPGEYRFTVVEGFAADVLLSRVGEVARERSVIDEFDAYLGQYTLFGDPPRNTGGAVRIFQIIVDRFIQDDVDVKAYLRADGPFPNARQAIGRIYARYSARLDAERQLDFSLLERKFLDRVVAGEAPRPAQHQY